MGGVEQLALLNIDGTEQDLGEPLPQQRAGFAGCLRVDTVQPGAKQEQAEVVIELQRDAGWRGRLRVWSGGFGGATCTRSLGFKLACSGCRITV